MKFAKMFFMILLIEAIAIYLLTSFVVWDINPAHWSGHCREFLVLALVVLSLPSARVAADT